MRRGRVVARAGRLWRGQARGVRRGVRRVGGGMVGLGAGGARGLRARPFAGGSGGAWPAERAGSGSATGARAWTPRRTAARGFAAGTAKAGGRWFHTRPIPGAPATCHGVGAIVDRRARGG
jgi:hypothetical protein